MAEKVEHTDLLNNKKSTTFPEEGEKENKKENKNDSRADQCPWKPKQKRQHQTNDPNLLLLYVHALTLGYFLWPGLAPEWQKNVEHQHQDW